MKKLSYLLLFCFLLLNLFSQSPPKNGLFISYFPDKKTVSEYGNYKGGKKNGVWITYESTGKIKKYISYQNGIPSGDFANFDINGNLVREGNYKIMSGAYSYNSGVEYLYDNGKPWKKIIYLEPFPVDFSIPANVIVLPKKIKETTYDPPTGIIRDEGFYIGEKKDSVWTHYDENGKLKAIETYKNGKRSGVSKRFSVNKNLIEKANFADGMFNGQRILLTESGDTIESGMYKDNKRNGFCKSRENLKVKDLSEDLKTYVVEGNYTQGRLNGHFILRYLNGKIAADENYADNKLNGQRKLYSENGNLIYSASYSDQRVSGKELKYFPSGKIKQETEYIDGIITGKQVTYFESGKKSEEAEYEKGRLKFLIHYHENGKVKAKSVYENNVPVKKEMWDEKGKKIDLNHQQNKKTVTGDQEHSSGVLAAIFSSEQKTAKNENHGDPGPALSKRYAVDSVFNFVEEMPEFPGGTSALMNFLSKNMKFSEAAVGSEMVSTIFSRFIVLSDGRVSDPEILKKTPCPDCEDEVIRVLKLLPKFKPGKMNGKAVNVYFNLPVKIHLK